MTDKATVRVGLIGCGAISGAYFNGCKPYGNVAIVACADMDPARAEAKAREFGVPRVCSVPELLAAPDIDVILNLTVPKAHAEVNLAALEAGKHAYCAIGLHVVLSANGVCDTYYNQA